MENLLKQLREEANFTQESIAERLDVSVNTIQNWERTGKIAKESLHDLLDLYGVTSQKREQVVLSIFGDSRVSEQKSKENNFPEFLFKQRPDILSAAKKASLTAEEMDLFGYYYYMTYLKCGDYGYGPDSWPLEYSVFKEHGGFFKTRSLINDIIDRLGRDLFKTVYNYGLLHPGSHFSFVEMDKKEILASIQNLSVSSRYSVDFTELYEQCKAVEKPYSLGYSLGTSLNLNRSAWPNIILSIVDSGYNRSRERIYVFELDEIRRQCFVIEKREITDNDYIMKKQQYLSDRKAYDEHPNLYEREPSFEYQLEYWLALSDIGKQYIEWVES